MDKLTTLDNIAPEVLDKLKEKYGENPNFRIIDQREDMIFGTKRDYFLLSKNRGYDDEFKFIWIGSNLWQFSYINIRCSAEAKWENPVDILNKLLGNI